MAEKNQLYDVDAKRRDRKNGEDIEPAAARGTGGTVTGSGTAGTASGGIAEKNTLSGVGTARTNSSAFQTNPAGTDSGALQALARTAAGNRLGYADVSASRTLLEQARDAGLAQAEAKTDYAVAQGVNALREAWEEAEARYQVQQGQIAADEARARDNQALYAAARGDRGGIAAAQYDSVSNAAMQNRAAADTARTQLAADTARGMADLRARGEFEKADALLNLTQQYLSQLMGLENRAAEYNLSVAKFNAGLDEWAAEYAYRLQQADLDAWQWRMNYDRAVLENDRKYNRSVYEDERDYNRSVLEKDRTYNRSVYEDERDYNRSVLETDRKYNRSVYENERDYNRGVYEDERDYAAQRENRAYTRAQSEASAAYTRRQALRSQTLDILKSGVMVDDASLSAAGIDKAYAQYLVSAARAKSA